MVCLGHGSPSMLRWSLPNGISAVGLNKRQIMAYAKWQEHQDSGQAKLKLF